MSKQPRPAWLDQRFAVSYEVEQLVAPEPPAHHADQIADDMKRAKTAKGVTSAWDKRGDIIDRIAEKFPNIHQNLLDIYQAEMNSYEEEADDEKI